MAHLILNLRIERLEHRLGLAADQRVSMASERVMCGYSL